MRIEELSRDDLLKLKQLYFIAVADEPPTYGELSNADNYISDELMWDIYHFVDIPEEFYIPEREPRFKHHIKANLPYNHEADEENVGEGVWVIVDDEAKTAHDADDSSGTFDCVLDNASCYWRGLYPGEVMPLEMRGNLRPVVPFEWLEEHFTINGEFFD